MREATFRTYGTTYVLCACGRHYRNAQRARQCRRCATEALARRYAGVPAVKKGEKRPTRTV